MAANNAFDAPPEMIAIAGRELPDRDVGPDYYALPAQLTEDDAKARYLSTFRGTPGIDYEMRPGRGVWHSRLIGAYETMGQNIDEIDKGGTIAHRGMYWLTRFSPRYVKFSLNNEYVGAMPTPLRMRVDPLIEALFSHNDQQLVNAALRVYTGTSTGYNDLLTRPSATDLTPLMIILLSGNVNVSQRLLQWQNTGPKSPWPRLIATDVRNEHGQTAPMFAAIGGVPDIFAAVVLHVPISVLRAVDVEGASVMFYIAASDQAGRLFAILRERRDLTDDDFFNMARLHNGSTLLEYAIDTFNETQTR
jgi:hypothetical protein